MYKSYASMPITINVNGFTFTFCNASRDTRHGFAHDCTLYINDRYSTRGRIYTTCHYYNRTWESYRYQSVMKQALSCLENDIETYLKEDYKIEHGLKRLAGETHKQAFAAMIENHDYMQAVKACMQELKEKRF